MSIIVISLDAELAWGFHDFSELPTDRIKNARDSWLELLDLFDQFDIPATWAIVGHLFLNECNGIHNGLDAPNGWFSKDPGGEANDTSKWFAPDLVQAVQDAEAEHEIGSHAFSHVEFGDRMTTKAIATSELRESNRVAGQWNIDLDSFVFPRNSIGHRQCLAEHGFSCYRGAEPSRWYDGSPLFPFGKAISMIRESPPLVEPRVDEYGLVNIPASLYLFTFDQPLGPFTKPALGDVIVRKAKRGINNAVNSKSVFHMWLHPNNLINDHDIDRIREIIRHLDRKRRTTDITVKTMHQIASDVARR